MNKSVLLSIAILIALGFALYANSLRGEFVWDDDFFIKNNPQIKDLSRIPQLFIAATDAGAGSKYVFYRPLQMFAHMLTYRAAGLNPVGYHLLSIIFHITTGLSLFWLVTLLFRDTLLALFSGILFITHPIHTEAISYVSGFTDPLMATFLLLAFVLYIKGLRSYKFFPYVLMLFSYTLALLAKESAIIFPGLLLIYHISFKEELKVNRLVPIAGIASLYLIIRLTVLQHMFPGLAKASTFFQRVPGFFVAITGYFKLLFLPFDLHIEYGRKLFTFAESGAIIGLLITLFLLIYAFKAWKKGGRPLLPFSLLWFFIALLPTSNLYPINYFMAEHWLYVPSMGLFIIAGSLLASLFRKRGYGTFALVVLLGTSFFYSTLTIKQNTFWRTPLALYEHAIRYVPDNVKINNNLGFAYHVAGKYAAARKALERAIAIDPNYEKSYNNLGLVCADTEKIVEAERLFRRAFDINPEYPEAHYNLGTLLDETGRREEAKLEYEKAIELKPNYSEACNNLGNILSARGDKERAFSLYKKAAGFNPDNPEAHANLSLIYIRKNKYDLAIKHYDKAASLGYEDPALLEALKPHRK
ncbi:MAG: tetratricopeptide repeat protein [Candidatus Omnitrophota bacterium]